MGQLSDIGCEQILISREIVNLIETFLLGFPVIGLTGPRQSGKTTLMKSMFPEYKYYNLESPDVRSFMRATPPDL